MTSTHPPILRLKDFGFLRCPEKSSQSPSQVNVKNVTELGNVLSSNTHIKRDLGFQGTLNGYCLLTYGDTMFSDVEMSDKWRGMTCNSIAVATQDPTVVVVPTLDENKFPHFFLKPTDEYNEDPAVYSLGITNIIEVSPGRGIQYFLLNHRPNGQNRSVGAGVAEITIDDSGSVPIPKAKRLCKYWWDAQDEPWYGDVCALEAGDQIYIYGHAQDNPWVYLARVATQSAFDLNAYEYWNGENWQKERMRRSELGEKQSVFWQVNQGQVIWSNYYKCFFFVYCDNFWSCSVLLRTASAPQGPWSDAVTVHKPKPIVEGGNIYAAIPHPYFDPSGKTLIVSYTNHPNTIQAIKVEFE